MSLERVLLPGIGVRHTVTTVRRQRLGVICHHSGRRDLVLYDNHAENVVATLVLEPGEACQVAGLLSSVVTVDHVASLERELAGVVAVRLRLPAGSAFEGRPLREIRTRAGLAIVAVVRRRQVVRVGAEFVLAPGDEIVAVGTGDDAIGLAARLGDSQSGP